MNYYEEGVGGLSLSTPKLDLPEIPAKTPKPKGMGLSGMLGVAGIATGIVTDTLGLVFDFWQYNEEKKRLAREQAKADKIAAEARKEEQARYDTQLAMTRSQQAEEKRRYKARVATENEDKQFNRGVQAFQNFFSVLSQKPQLEQGLMSRFPTRRYF